MEERKKSNRVPEAETGKKNGASLKSRMSIAGAIRAIPMFLRRKSGVKKAVQECATALDTYIHHLGFVPTAIYATVLCIPNKKDVAIFSKYAINTFSCAKTLADKYKSRNKNCFYYPHLGVFLNADKKLFAVRSKPYEISPKVYKFSQLQDFALSEDVCKSIQADVNIPPAPFINDPGGKPLGKLSMRVVFTGTNGPESVTLEPEINLSGENGLREWISTNDPVYKIRCEELLLICEGLRGIKAS